MLRTYSNYIFLLIESISFRQHHLNELAFLQILFLANFYVKQGEEKIDCISLSDIINELVLMRTIMLTE